MIEEELAEGNERTLAGLSYQRNVEVAQKLGWQRYDLCVPPRWGRKDWPADASIENLPDYVDSIDDAWEIMDFLVGKELSVNLCYGPVSKKWLCLISDMGKPAGKLKDDSPELVVSADALTPARAICEAFLKIQ